VAKLLLVNIALSPSNRLEAGLILEWDFADNSGVTLMEPAIESFPDRVSGIDFSRGDGLNATRLNRGFGTSGWASSDPTDFISFGFEVAEDYALQLDNLQLRTVSSPQGPGTLGLFYSGDNFSAPIQLMPQAGSRFNDFNLDLSALGTMAGPVEFRIQQIGNQNRNGETTRDSAMLGIANYNGNIPVSLNGTLTTAVPESSAAIAIFACLASLQFRRSREQTPCDRPATALQRNRNFSKGIC
jgi:hypothetical protein